jgi:1-acyl-sn-glycerol-3-phosphate acyltransferase
MEKIISYPISIVSTLLFLLALVIFQPIQWLCFYLFGYQAHKKSVDYLNLILMRIAHLLGNTYEFNNRDLIPKGVPVIFVANHQSLFDIVRVFNS